MTVDKSFVVRQGLEVATDLLYTDLTNRRVGIGSTFPSTTLDVNGGIGATDLRVAGFVTVTHDVQVGASGSVFYISDSSNNVGIGTSIPVYTLDVITPVSTGQTGLHVKGDALFSGIINAESISVSGVTSFTYVTVDNSLVVTGTGATTTTLNVTGVSTFADDVSFGSTATFGDNDKLKFGDSQDLEIYHDGSHSYIDDSGTGNLYLRSGTLSIQNLAGSKTSAVFQSGSSQELYHNNFKKFETTGFGVTVTGIVSASSYYGDGSNVTGLVTSITAGDFISIDSSTGNVTITGLANTANVSADTLVVTGVSTLGVVTGVTAIEATSYYGDGSNLTGLVTSITAGDFISIDSSTENVTITGLANTANVRADTLVVTGVSTLGIVTGVTSIEATTYYGDGSNLTGVSTANVRADTLVVTGVSTLGIVTGVTSIEATTYYGNGSNLTGLTPTQVGAMGDLVDDTTPQLGGNLDINGKYITGTGGVDITGIITATSFDGTAADASKISVADESSDTTCFPLFAKSATGIVSAFSGSNLTFNSSDGTLSSTSFSGDGSNVTNVDADTVDTLHASSFLRSDTASTASGNISFTSTTTPITTNAVKFNNTENDGNYYTDATGVLAFDENFYSDTNYGTGTYDPATVFTGTNGGGILIKNEDGWGAVFTTQNTRYATAEWDGLTVDGNRVLTTADAGAGNGMDADTVDTLHASSFLRSDANDSATGLYSFAAGAYSANVTYGGRSIQTQIDINSTSMRGGVLVRNANDFRSETDTASFMHYDAYNTSATSYAFRAAKGTTLADTFWVKGDGTAYFADDIGIGTSSPTAKLDVEGNVRVVGGGGDTGTGLVAYTENSGEFKSVLAGFRLGLFTGQNNARTESVRIDENGRMLIGSSTAPNTNFNTTAGNLCVDETALPVVFTQYTNDQFGPRIDFVKSRSTTYNGKTIVNADDSCGTLIFGGADGTNIIPLAQITGQVDGTPGINDMPGRLVLATTADGASTPTERLRITSGGRVGIGTTSPGYVLETAGDIRINPPSGNAVFRFGRAGSNDWAIYNDTLDNLVFYSDAGGAERARIDSSGRMYINNTGPLTSSPASLSKFTVTGNTIGAGNIGYINLHNLANISTNFGLGAINFAGQANNGYTGAQIFARADANWSSTSYPTSLLFYTVASGSSTLSERMRITSSGNVGIGTDAAGYKLEVNGDIKVGELGTLWFSDTSGSIEKIESTESALNLYADSTISFYESDASAVKFTINTNAATAYFSADSDTHWYRPAANTHAWTTSNVERFRIASDGIATFNSGEVVFGGTAVSATEGGQIRLTSASGQSNGDTIIDMNSANFRIFYSNSPNKGAYLTLSSLADGVGSRILTTSDEGAGNGMDADTVDTLHASSFLRSDANAYKTSGILRFNDNLNLQMGTDNDIAFFYNGSDFYMDFNTAGDSWYIRDTNDNAVFGFSATGNLSLYTGDLNVGDGGDNSRILIKKADNDFSDHIQFYNGTTRIGEIGCQDTSWLRINQVTNKNIYTPRLMRADGGFAVGSSTVWHSGNDGSGSGLDADTVDGIQGANFLRSDTSDTMSGNLSLYGNLLLTGNVTTTNQGRLIDFTGFDKESTADFTDRAYIQHTVNTGGHTGSVLVISSQNDANDGIAFLTNGSSQLKHNSNTIWTAGNDGAGSGLDADNLDGFTWASSGKDVRATEFYADNWFRNYNSGEGLYNQATTQYFYSDSDDGWNIAGGTGANWLRFRDEYNGTIRGYLYSDTASSIGFLNAAAQWGLRYLSTDGLSPNLYFLEEGNETWSGNPPNNQGKIEYHSNRFYIAAGNNSTEVCVFRRSGGDVVRISNSGDITASGDVTAFSDITLKEDVEVIPNALDKVSQIRGVTFTRKDLEDKSRKSGVIAQEVEKVLPEVVTTTEDGTKTVAYGNLVGLLIESIKELKAEVAELKEKCK